ncbi:MAG: gcdC [Firmicutes bacterium]|nr:gcdC [Bacillota bacterium]
MKKFKVNVNGTSYTVEVAEEGRVAVAPVAVAAPVPARAAVMPAAPISVAAPAVQVAVGDTQITAPMPGKVSKIMKKVGDKIVKGDCIMTLEAMKMQNEIGAPVGGTIKSIHVSKGDGAKPGQILAVISN